MAYRCEVTFGWMKDHMFYYQGNVVRVTMVSRFGDCGITTDITEEAGYSDRVEPEELEPIDGMAYTLIKCDCLFCRTNNGLSPFAQTWEIPKGVRTHRPHGIIHPTRTLES